MQVRNIFVILIAGLSVVSASQKASCQDSEFCRVPVPDEVFCDDFSDGSLADGQPVSWRTLSGQTSLRDDSLVISRQIPGFPRVTVSPAPTLSDISIRSQIRLPQGGQIGFATRTGAVGPRGDYGGFLWGDRAVVGIGGSNSEVFADAPFEFDYTTEDTLIQFDVFDDHLQFWAWPAGETMPSEPLVSAVNDELSEGGFYLWASVGDSGDSETTGMFRFVQVATQPIRPLSEPSTGEEFAITIPANLESLEGDDGSDGDEDFPNGIRMHIVYHADQFADLGGFPADIVGQAYRPDVSVTQAAEFYQHGVTNYLGTFTGNPHQLSLVYDENLPNVEDLTLVVQGDRTFSTNNVTTPEGTKEFDIVAMFDEPYEYDPSKGDLFLETSYQSASAFPVDATLQHHTSDWIFAGSDDAAQASARGTRAIVTRWLFDITPGDFDNDHDLNTADLDRLATRIREQAFSRRVDLNEDGQIDMQDHRHWVIDLKGTWYGDANLDGEFNSGDLVAVFTVGKYESEQESGWAEGDWNADGVFGSGDLVFAFQDGGYEQGPRVAVAAVPEPSTGLLLAFAATFAVSSTRRKRP